jgi:hypothetical protein
MKLWIEAILQRLRAITPIHNCGLFVVGIVARSAA